MGIFRIIFTCLLLHHAAIASKCPDQRNAVTMQDIKHAIHMSETIYKNNLKEGSRISQTPFILIKEIHKNLFQDGEGIRVGIADHGNTRMIVYRGTDGLEQLFEQFKSSIKSLLYGKHQVTLSQTPVKVLKFFWNAYRLVSYQLRPFIADASKRYIITGHSLGGALASLLAIDAVEINQGSVWQHPASCLITFGQPRVGDSSYADLHDKLIPTFRKFRFVHKSDLITKIPPLIAGFRHHSRAVYMGYKRSWSWGKKDSSEKHRHKNEEDLKEVELFDEQVEEVLEEKVRSDNLDSDEFHQVRNHSRDKGGMVPLPKEIVNYTQQEKRFVKIHYKPYLRLCTTGESFRCVTHLLEARPKMIDHAIESYRKMLESIQSIQTIKKSERNSFEEAVVASCKGFK